jgi:hypothetical protein
MEHNKCSSSMTKRVLGQLLIGLLRAGQTHSMVFKFKKAFLQSNIIQNVPFLSTIKKSTVNEDSCTLEFCAH